jgi:hypothetical protein
MPEPSRPARQPWRNIGFWLCAAIVLLLARNVFASVNDPAGFAAYLGLPLAPADAGWTSIYALRTGFIAGLVLVLMLRGDFAGLTWVAAIGVLLPLGDAALTYQAGAGQATVARHLAIAAYLLVTAAILIFESRARARPEA